MPPGPEQDARNAACRLQKRDWDDGNLKSEFENLQSLFGYDAEDAAEVRNHHHQCAFVEVFAAPCRSGG